MARVLTAAVIAELKAARSRPVWFVEAEFSSGIVNLWTGLGSIVFDSKTWEGIGKLGGISVVTETSDLRAENLVLSLSGLPASILTNVLDEIRFGKAATVQMGYLTEAGAVIADPFIYFKGTIDKGQVDEGGETATAQVNVESEMAALRQPKEFRHTSEDQKAEHPTDEGFDHVVSILDFNEVWGRSTAAIPLIPVTPSRPTGGGESRL